MVMRTTLVLDERSRAAARELAAQYKCSVSEAIRRAIVMQRDGELALSSEQRRRRKAAFRQLCALFEGNDPAEEVRRLKREDEGF